ncbi:acyl-CoA dehydrogenase [bacterium]|nr:acyl-CoA dehydrogenase [bacterium]
MSSYTAPLKEMMFVLNELADLESICDHIPSEDVTVDVVAAALEESAKLASDVLSPLNTVGDTTPARVENNAVYETPGFKEAYAQFVEGGWMSIAFDPEYGGMGLPEVLTAPAIEAWCSANMGFAIGPTLTMGAISAIYAHADEAVKQKYLPKMISGEWSGTMNLTEPQAGSDLAVVRAKAEPKGDHYLISGTKIFISWGDHQMTDNIIHLVLARTPDAPPGVKGISLFVVPKFLVNDDGSIGERNDLHCSSVEHKMGIHASPTCVMNYGENGGAIGYLVGQENRGLMHMFTMMNIARLHVGIQGYAVGEQAYQKAVQYAKDRVQGRPLTGGENCTIVNHPDVRRMLLTMRGLTEAARAISYVALAQADKVHAKDPNAQARLDYLTPIAKGFSTEIANEVTSLGVQVHGGMGFVEETGAAQYMRDARITGIYEGTNGIQAMDLAGRKFTQDGGKMFEMMMAEITESLASMSAEGAVGDIKTAIASSIEELKTTADWIMSNTKTDINALGTSAFNFLMQNGYVIGGWLLAKSADIAQRKLSEDPEFYQAKINTALFYTKHILPRAVACSQAAMAEASCVMDFADEAF